MTYQTDTPYQHQNLVTLNAVAVEAARLVEEGDIDLNPPYQRGSVWTTEQRMFLVRSWLTGVPVPAICLNDRFATTGDVTSPGYAVIDGKQRLEAAHAWFFGDLAVPASWFPADFVESTQDTDDGPYVTYANLSRLGQNVMRTQCKLPRIQVTLATVAEEAALYVLLEQSGTAQTDSDVARAQAVADAS